VIRRNRPSTVREVAAKVSISIGPCHKIFTEKTSDASRQCKIRAAFVGRNVGNGLSPVEGTILKGTELKML
jgi:hypothetical protein